MMSEPTDMSASRESNGPLQRESVDANDESGQTTDDGKARIFPCEACGADLRFHIGQQRLKCEYCGFEKALELRPGGEIREQDFAAMLERLSRQQETEEVPPDVTGVYKVRCESCSGTVVFVGTLTSSECPYCGSPIQREKVHTASTRIPVDGVLPFLIEHDQAQRRLSAWVRSRWFAPHEFLRRANTDKFNGVYLPYWTFDSLTFNEYRGQRGEHYTTTVGVGKNRRTKRKTRWHAASGEFQRFFDDILVSGTRGLPQNLIESLEPWTLSNCIPFTAQVLAGSLACTYDVDLEEAFFNGRARMDAAIHSEVRRRIGGDEQRVHSVTSRYDAVTYKLLLLPVWMLAYRYQNTPFRVFVNAATGEVQGERPYSWTKIALAVLGAVCALGGLFLVVSSR